MSDERVKVGLIGCGSISGIYCQNLQRYPHMELLAVADILPERAQAKAAEHGIAACSVEEMLANPEIEIIVNTTIPKAHAEIALAALSAGKSVYSEKPLAVARADGQRMLALADEKGLLVGCAPDTFLGGGLQTCRKLIDEGAIGEPVAATAFMMGHGPEDWHPDPEFFFKQGAGPMFDMGPYYLTALINLIGPVRRVSGSARITFPQRVIGSEPKRGTIIDVEVPTHVTGVMDFAGGAVGTIITSWDVWGANLPNIEIYGSEGSMRVPDPNTFGGPIFVRKARSKEWVEMPLQFGHDKNARGIAVADMARAIRTGRAHRANGRLAYHVLDLMHAFHDASREERHVYVSSTTERPAPLPAGLATFTID